MATITYTPTELQALAAQLEPYLVITPTPPIPPPTDNAFWLYHDGVFSGAGDYSYGNQPFSIVYDHPAVGASGAVDVLATGDVGWQPRMPGDDFNATGYNFVTVSIKPTQKQTWVSGMEMIGDKPIPGSSGQVNIMKYGPNPAVIGQWNTYKIPLSAYGQVGGTYTNDPYKIAFQGQNVPSPSTNQVEYDNVGFLKA